MKNKTIFTNSINTASADLAGKKILFGNFPAEGHFNPLTGLAVHLKSIGCDVRWYTSDTYASKLKKSGIPHYPFKKALDVTGDNIERLFPERKNINGKIAKLNFDMVHAFILRGPEYFEDLQEIYKDFQFDILVADCCFTAIPFVADKMNIPVISIGIAPLFETSKDLAPYGLGITPSYSFFGKLKQNALRFLANKVLFRKSNKVLRKTMEEHHIDHFNMGIFDIVLKKSNIFLQSGTPGFEYYRSDLGRNIRFIGPLLPYQSKKDTMPWFNSKLNQFKKIVVVTQGTVEKNVEKILVPTLEAFKDSDVLVIATTGGSETAALRQRYPQSNLIIEDFIPFGDIMPYADAYITNGGYGGVLLGIENQLPLVVAGVHEGKNEINARIGFFKLGINLQTETPKPYQLKAAVKEILENNIYKKNVSKLAEEFNGYKPNELTEHYLKEVLVKNNRRIIQLYEEQKVY